MITFRVFRQTDVSQYKINLEAMKQKLIHTILLLILSSMVIAQRPSMELTFTAIDSTSYLQIDSIKVMNRTQGGDTLLYWPDTVLVLNYQVGISEINNGIGKFQVFQNYPNPVADQTIVSLFVPVKDNVSIIITDMLGRVILKSDRVMGKGTHSFRFAPGGGYLYLITAKWRGITSSIKTIQTSSNTYVRSSLEYIGSIVTSPQFKATKDTLSFSFNLGDKLLYIGYENGLQSGKLDTPETSQTYTFQFATNIPCPGSSTVIYEGQVYNTIQIFSQCWLKENLNVGTMIPDNQHMSNNGLLEKYCYNNETDSCNKYGGLYQWNEMMQYTTHQGSQGICPQGWHIPSDSEWKVLEGAVDSQFGIGDPEWDIQTIRYRGYDVGTNLKTTSSWTNNGNGTDLFGFSALPGGCRIYDGGFGLNGVLGYWWPSSQNGIFRAWYRSLVNYASGVYRDNFENNKDYGFSVRCVQDN
jgi:uncharacterized protein (TIGR02145 family)